MNRINQLFSTKQKDILSIYFCAGFPTLEGTASTIKVLEKKGINMIEIGIPFSDLNVPVLGAGGIFSGKEAVDLMKKTGASGIQAATRFTIAQESGLPDPVKQVYIDAKDEDVEVNHASPTGYLMRMLKNSPALTANNRPNCESYGYMLSHGSCPYLKEWLENSSEKTKCCLCTNMRNYKVWTCGTSVSRLKTTTVRGQDGKWVLPTAEQIFNDYRLA